MANSDEQRRQGLPFDTRHFEKRRVKGDAEDPQSRFREIYRTNHWSGGESRSGEGAGISQTEHLREVLPTLLKQLQVQTLLDLPCGDLAWISRVELPVSSYIGGDIVPELIEDNRERFPESHRQFQVLDITADPLPKADLLLCRDCFVHLSFEAIEQALANVRTAPISWLMATTFPGCRQNTDIVTGDWRPVNLCLPPFSLPAPHKIIEEQCTEADGLYHDKSIGLWKVEEL